MAFEPGNPGGPGERVRYRHETPRTLVWLDPIRRVARVQEGMTRAQRGAGQWMEPGEAMDFAIEVGKAALRAGAELSEEGEISRVTNLETE